MIISEVLDKIKAGVAEHTLLKDAADKAIVARNEARKHVSASIDDAIGALNSLKAQLDAETKPEESPPVT